MSAVASTSRSSASPNNAMITPFAATASVLTGIEAGLRAQGKKPDDCTVVGFAGDGGTADIGIQRCRAPSTATMTCCTSATTTRRT